MPPASTTSGSSRAISRIGWRRTANRISDDVRSAMNAPSEHDDTARRDHHRRLAGHRRRPREGLPRARLRRDRERSVDRAVRGRRPRRDRGRRRPARDGRADRGGGARALRPDRHADQQRRHLHRQAVHGLHARGLQRADRRQPRRLLSDDAARDRADARAGQWARRERLDGARRAARSHADRRRCRC